MMRITMIPKENRAIHRALCGVVYGIATKLGGRGVGMASGSYASEMVPRREFVPRSLADETEGEYAGMIFTDPSPMMILVRVEAPSGLLVMWRLLNEDDVALMLLKDDAPALMLLKDDAPALMLLKDEVPPKGEGSLGMMRW